MYRARGGSTDTTTNGADLGDYGVVHQGKLIEHTSGNRTHHQVFGAWAAEIAVGAKGWVRESHENKGNQVSWD